MNGDGSEKAPAGSAAPAPSLPPAAAPPPAPFEEAEVAAPGVSLGTVLLAALLAILVVVAALYFLPSLLSLANRADGPPPAVGHTEDLCNASRGTFCTGNQLVVPTGASNLSGCGAIPIPNHGTGEQLWLNYSLDRPMIGFLVPTTSYATLQSRGASSFLNDSSTHGLVPWTTHGSTGPNGGRFAVPSDPIGWCVVWWEPSGTARLTWLTDVSIGWLASS